MNLDAIIRDILNAEGGFTSNPRDKGHQLRQTNGDKYDSYATNRGITQDTLSKFLGRQASLNEVRNLTEHKAVEIYKVNYYYKFRLDELLVGIQPLAFDMVVQHRFAIRLLQKTVNSTNQRISEDNVMGSNTIETVNSLLYQMDKWFINMVNVTRIHYYDRLGRSNRWAMRGWLIRAEKFVETPHNGSEQCIQLLKTVRGRYGLVQ